MASYRRKIPISRSNLICSFIRQNLYFSVISQKINKIDKIPYEMLYKKFNPKNQILLNKESPLTPSRRASTVATKIPEQTLIIEINAYLINFQAVLKSIITPMD